jgi:Homing endonuclease associated repeat
MKKKTERRNDPGTTYTEEELLNSLKSFCLKNGRIPTKGDLTKNPEYPSFSTYRRRFKTWSNALKKMSEIK